MKKGRKLKALNYNRKALNKLIKRGYMGEKDDILNIINFDLYDYSVKLLKKYVKQGYESVRSDIVQAQKHEWFPEFIRKVQDVLFSSILNDDKIDINYDIVKGLNEVNQRMWIFKNSSNIANLGEEEKKLLSEIVYKHNFYWAMNQYLGEISQCLNKGDDSIGVRQLGDDGEPLLMSNYLTKEEIVVKDLKNGENGLLAQYIADLTRFYMMSVPEDFIKLLLENNPSPSVLRECVYGFNCPVDLREELITKFIKVAKKIDVDYLFEFENLARGAEGNIFSGSNQEVDKRCNKLIKTLLNRGDFFDNYSSDSICDIATKALLIDNRNFLYTNLDNENKKILAREAMKKLQAVENPDVRDFYVNKFLSSLRVDNLVNLSSDEVQSEK